MTAGAGDATFETSDGSAIAFTLHRAPKAGAPRLALIHSLALDRSVWDGVVKRLSDEAELLTYDCRGHGRSERRATAFTAELFARDLAELLDHLGWPSAAFGGCSMGGCVAMALAGLFPERVCGLGLIDTTAWYGEQAPAQWRARAADARVKGLPALVDFQVERWFGDAFRRDHPALVARAAEVFVANDFDCYAASCALLGDADLRPYLPGVRVPVSIMVGEEDYATPMEMSRRLHEAIPRSTLTVLPGARHLTPVECPDQVGAQLRTVLQRA
jgi:3-oxoadipate enol-lactonase